jgi:hypothetical protein
MRGLSYPAEFKRENLMKESCAFCVNEKTLIEFKELCFVGWASVNSDLKKGDVDYEKQVIFVDSRGYLVKGNPDNCQCLDHVEKVKIKYCPMCGMTFNLKGGSYD